MHIVNLSVALALSKIQLRPLESFHVVRVNKTLASLGRRDARKLRKELGATVANQSRKVLFVIGEIEKRAGGCELLSLKEHGCSGCEQHQGGHSSVATGAGLLVNALASCGVCDLIVILNEGHEFFWRQMQRTNAAP